MKKGFRLFTLLSFLLFFTSSVCAQSQANDDGKLEDNIENTDVQKSKEDLLQEIETLKKEKLLIPSDKNDSHEEIDDEIDVIQEKIDALKYLETEKSKQYLGTPVFDKEDFWKLLIKGLFNLLIILVIVRYIYYPVTRNKDYLFTYLLISLTVFLLCFLLDNVKLELGFALGLFAIFGIIRYRTDPIPIKEMTYLFIVIGISVVNALSNKKISYAELVFANLMIVFVTFGMERLWLLKHETRKNIIYEKIELIKPENKEELLADLKERTGLNIVRYEIRRIDFLKDIANIRIFYYEDDSK
ncbi:MAG TPA: DUF4956 domain-containing protein [Flavobacteriales bacterium]|nr:DUF4956 domain-containing protein [Flavobacteriales bacterium]